MSLYVDTSAMLKRYVDEPDCAPAEQYLLADTVWITARHTPVEIRRILAQLLDGGALAAARSARPPAAAPWMPCTWRRRCGSVAAGRSPSSPLIVRQAQAARTLGLAIVGA